MSIIFKDVPLKTGTTPAAPTGPTTASKKKRYSHTKPRALTISLDQPGRLRLSDVLGLFGIKAATYYEGRRYKRYPMPDGKDGRRPYWNTETIRNILSGNTKGEGAH
jgi:hypothetical protein